MNRIYKYEGLRLSTGVCIIVRAKNESDAIEIVRSELELTELTDNRDISVDEIKVKGNGVLYSNTGDC